MVKVCDVVTINAPLHPETEGLFNDKLLRPKRGALFRIPRGHEDRDAIRPAPSSGYQYAEQIENELAACSERPTCGARYRLQHDAIR